jgi:hypothetical protein
MESTCVFVQYDRDRIQSPKCCVLKEDRMMDNVQNCDSYNNKHLSYLRPFQQIINISKQAP